MYIKIQSVPHREHTALLLHTPMLYSEICLCIVRTVKHVQTLDSIFLRTRSWRSQNTSWTRSTWWETQESLFFLKGSWGLYKQQVINCELMILKTDFYWSVNIAPTVWRNTKMIKHMNNNALKRNFKATFNEYNSYIFSFFIRGGRRYKKPHNQRREILYRKLQVPGTVLCDRSEVESTRVLCFAPAEYFEVTTYINWSLYENLSTYTLVYDVLYCGIGRLLLVY